MLFAVLVIVHFLLVTGFMLGWENGETLFFQLFDLFLFEVSARLVRR
jgi:hypothetical protein